VTTTTATGTTATGTTATGTTRTVTVPVGSTSRLPASTLLALARRGLVEACDAATAGERYATAHLAALRVAAAVLACRARPVDGAAAPPRRTRPTSAWVLLAAVAPELGEWAAFFAAGAAKRAAAEAGLPSAVTPREADDLVRDVEAFLTMVEGSLGVPGSQLLLASG
jgi:L-fucose isomerase-like protein